MILRSTFLHDNSSFTEENICSSFTKIGIVTQEGAGAKIQLHVCLSSFLAFSDGLVILEGKKVNFIDLLLLIEVFFSFK